MGHKSQLASGARGVIQIQKGSVVKTLGMGTDINVDVRMTVRSTYVMGELNPVSLDNTAVDCTASIGRVIPVSKNTVAAPTDGDQITATSQASRSDGAASAQASVATRARDIDLETAIENILTEEAVTIMLYDHVSGQYLGKITEARFAGRTLTTPNSDIANERINYVGIYDAANPDQAPVIGYGFNQ